MIKVPFNRLIVYHYLTLLVTWTCLLIRNPRDPRYLSTRKRWFTPVVPRYVTIIFSPPKKMQFTCVKSQKWLLETPCFYMFLHLLLKICLKRKQKTIIIYSIIYRSPISHLHSPTPRVAPVVSPRSQRVRPASSAGRSCGGSAARGAEQRSSQPETSQTTPRSSAFLLGGLSINIPYG